MQRIYNIAPPRLRAGLVAPLLIVVLLLGIAYASCTTIDSGSVGIRFKKWSSDASQYGGVLGTCKGWVWFNPMTS